MSQKVLRLIGGLRECSQLSAFVLALLVLLSSNVLSEPIAFYPDPVVEIEATADANPRSVAIGDVDGDGVNDIITIGLRIYLTRGTSNGAFEPPEFIFLNNPLNPIWPGGAIGSLRQGELADLDNDGDLDLIVSAIQVHQLAVFYNDGTGSFSPPEQYSSGIAPSITGTDNAFHIFDANQDGLLDLIYLGIQEQQAAVLLNTGSGAGNLFLPPASTYTLNLLPRNVSSGDLDQDGDSDVIFSSAGNVPATNILVNDGTGSFTVSGFFQPTRTTDVRVVDVNDDGLNDVVYSLAPPNLASSPPPGFAVLTQDVFGNFSTEIVETNYSLHALEVVDLNQDGFMDLIGRSAWTEEMLVIVNGDSSGESIEFTIDGNFQDHLIKVADLTADGQLDLLTEGTLNTSTLPNTRNLAIYHQFHTPCGDANGDGARNIADVYYLGGYLFQSFEQRVDLSVMNINGDNSLNVADVVYLYHTLFVAPGEQLQEPQCARL